ncbi:MAG: response regulator [Desulfobacteraceae bacterium]|nr:MAG: response regulator [Desulfobacteraceae bacterium]
MKKEVSIIIAEDDEGHATLIRKNLRRAGVLNEIIHLRDGQEALDYLFQNPKGRGRKSESRALLLLDINMPRVDGIEVLRRVKEDPELCKMPVIMLTTTDDPREVERCHKLGCSNYITKPIEYDQFVAAIRQLGLFLLIVEIPIINGDNEG